MKEQGLSRRQLSAAVLAGGLAPASAAAAYGWQGPVLAVFAVFFAAWFLLELGEEWERMTGSGAGKVLRPIWALWGALLMSRWLGRCAGRIELTGGGEKGTALWIGLLLLPVLLWMAAKGTGAFFRSSVLLCPVLLTVLAVISIWGGCRGEWRYAAPPALSLGEGFWAGVESAAGLLFALPYINKAGLKKKVRVRLAWTGGLVPAAAALMAAVTAVVLSPGVIPLTEEPFFTMAACLGSTARVEGLVSALWLAADLIWIGLLARGVVWDGRERSFLSAGMLFFAGVFWLTGAEKVFPSSFWGVGTAALWGATAVLLLLCRKNSGRTRKGETTSCG